MAPRERGARRERREHRLPRDPDRARGVRVPAAGLPGFRRAIARRWQRDASPGSPAAALGSTTLYEEVALTALASVDAEQAREFVTAELGPLTATDDDSVRLSTTLRVYLEET